MSEYAPHSTIPEDIDVSGTAHESINQLIQCIDTFQKHPFRIHLPSDCIAIGPRSKKGKGPSLSERILRMTTNNEQSVSSMDKGSSKDIFCKIIEQQNQVQENIGIVLMSFFLHNFEKEDQYRLLKSLNTTFPNAAVIVNDYTLLGVPEEKVPHYLASEFETEIMEHKGVERFIKEHRCFTLQSLKNVVEQHFPFVYSTPLKAARGLVIGHKENVWDEKQLSSSALIDAVPHQLLPAA